MKIRWLLILLLGAALGFAGGASLVSALQTRASARPPVRLAGQVVPGKAIPIDFTKTFDITIVPRYGQGPIVLSGVRLIGLTPDAREDEAMGSGGYATVFDRWLALEERDGRRAFVPKDSIVSLVESAAPPRP